jgi:hypothetical protein
LFQRRLGDLNLAIAGCVSGALYEIAFSFATENWQVFSSEFQSISVIFFQFIAISLAAIFLLICAPVTIGLLRAYSSKLVKPQEIGQSASFTHGVGEGRGCSAAIILSQFYFVSGFSICIWELSCLNFQNYERAGSRFPQLCLHGQVEFCQFSFFSVLHIINAHPLVSASLQWLHD